MTQPAKPNHEVCNLPGDARVRFAGEITEHDEAEHSHLEHPQPAVQPPEPPKTTGQPGIAGPVFVIAQPAKAQVEARGEEAAGENRLNAPRPPPPPINGYSNPCRFSRPALPPGSDGG